MDRLTARADSEVRSVIELYRDRFNDGDADGLAEVYSPDISFVNLGGVPFAGRQATRAQQASGFRGDLGRITIDVRIDSTGALGADFAIALVRQSIASHDPPGGSAATVATASTMTMILDRTSGRWLIRHVQNTPILKQWTQPAGDEP